MWYLIEPFAGGYIGVSSAGTIWGVVRAEVIAQLIAINYK